ncbi:MAG: DUF3450 domain-containing protein, partial [Gammaproteobacteria bacterium]|nr:DUF3450 domain-containing protein [Gammaproteobacteria bacterium]
MRQEISQPRKHDAYAQIRKSFAGLVLGGTAMVLPISGFAQTIDQVLETGEAKAAEGKASQAKIDQVVDAKQGKLIKYR